MKTKTFEMLGLKKGIFQFCELFFFNLHFVIPLFQVSLSSLFTVVLEIHNDDLSDDDEEELNQFNKNFQEEIDNLCKKGTPIQASPALVTQLFLTLLQLEYRVQLPVINLISKFIHSHYFSKEHWPKKPQSPFHGVHRNPVGMSCYHLSFLPLDSYSHYSF